MRWHGLLDRFAWVGAWSLIVGVFVVELLQLRQLRWVRRRLAEVSREASTGGRTAALPEMRFDDRDETHQGGARYD